MSDWLQRHFDAVHDRLELHAALSGKVDDTLRYKADGTYERANYILLTGGVPAVMGGDRQAAFMVEEDNASFDWRLRHVGISPNAVRLLMAASFQQFSRWVPQIMGRRCTSMRYPRGQRSEIQMEDSVKPPLYYADTQWTFGSNFTNSGS